MPFSMRILCRYLGECAPAGKLIFPAFEFQAQQPMAITLNGAAVVPEVRTTASDTGRLYITEQNALHPQREIRGQLSQIELARTHGNPPSEY